MSTAMQCRVKLTQIFLLVKVCRIRGEGAAASRETFHQRLQPGDVGQGAQCEGLELGHSRVYRLGPEV